MLKMTLNDRTLKKLMIWGRTVSELQISVLHSRLLPPSAVAQPIVLEDSVVKRSAPVVFFPQSRNRPLPVEFRAAGIYVWCKT